MAHYDPQAPTRAYPSDGLAAPDDNDHELQPGAPLAQVGRYRIERALGKGGFGQVYLARDLQLDRLVAVKVPHPRHIAGPEDAKPYLVEARTVARLDHPHIVPVHDVGSTAEHPCYIVSKFVEGCDLAHLIRKGRLDYRAAADIVACIAEALHYAHKRGVVHRDIKPGNILIDRSGKPHVVDFGLALLEQDSTDGNSQAGTPAYMSPEQARGEGHRVDGRSDIYSLGAVLYELLAGRRKVTETERAEILQQIVSQDPKPPRQINDRIPRELERICLKALSRRASDRYTTALDFADDLRSFLNDSSEQVPTAPGAGDEFAFTSFGTETESGGMIHTAPLRVVPKGLRSFDERDADFFAELLPGPRGRDGLPDSLRFWKSRIEETNPDELLTIGIIYGPSGCGKSSLMKAGLLPRLSDDVTPVYIEATPEETESRLLTALRKCCPSLDQDLGLKDALASLRRTAVSPRPGKVLIIIDQFEQWLHGHQEDCESDLIQALRQCDGVNLQCIILVRDDFWMATTRFMRELEVPIRETVNSAAVDLFPITHAEKVLAAFGRAFGALPADTTQTTPEQHEFVRQSVAGLAEGGRVICVRLALFAEMIKERPWVPKTLRDVGGAQGVGVAFLEDAFRSTTAPLERRHHQKAARAILKALLPASGTDIKGEMKSYGELLKVSGYSDRPAEFVELIRILDNDTRLISPTDPEGLDSGDSQSSPRPGEKYFQLTHDYLVASLRIWLTRKQKETRRGRAELRLAEHAANWAAKPETRRLPPWWDTLSFPFLTDSSSWTPAERQMMRSARFVHGRQLALALLLTASTGLAIHSILRKKTNQHEEAQASTIVTSVMTAPPDAVPYLVKDLEPVKHRAIPFLEEAADSPTSSLVRRLRANAVLTSYDSPREQQVVDAIGAAPSAESDTVSLAVERNQDRSIRLLKEKLSTATDPVERARLAIVLLQLGNADSAVQMLDYRPDPKERVRFIDTLSKWHSRLPRILEGAARTESGAVRSGVALGLGAIPVEKVPEADREEVIAMIRNWYQTEHDAGTHGAARWLLTQWGVGPTDTPTAPAAHRDWYHNSIGLTLVRVPPGSGVDQGPAAANRLWVSDREVSRAIYHTFLDDPDYPQELKPKYEDKERAMWAERSPTMAHPMLFVSWNDSIAFYNWLSRRESLEPFYEKTEKGWKVRPTANGYRHPTEAEWELACRAGTTTPYSCGDTEFLSHFAVFQSNTTLPCGSKMPNPWGLFDMHGNVYEWCQEIWIDPTRSREQRTLRSGAFDYTADLSKTMERKGNFTTYRQYTIGFRPVRNE